MPKRRVLLFVVTMLAVVAIDQIAKAVVRSSFAIGESRPLIDGAFWLTHVHNTGAAFGMFGGQRWLLVGIAVVVLVGILIATALVRPESLVARTALALIAGGAAGNLIDRALAGGVTDFFDLGWWPVFNVADMCLDIGVALLIWWLLFSKEHDTRDASPSPYDDGAAPAAASAPVEGPDGSVRSEAHESDG